MSANVNRGEYELTVDDSTFTLVLTLDELEEIEQNLSCGLTELLIKLSQGVPRSKDISTVLRLAFRNVRPRIKPIEMELVFKRVPSKDRYIAVTRLLMGALGMTNAPEEEDDTDSEAVGLNGAGPRPLSVVTESSTGDS